TAGDGELEQQQGSITPARNLAQEGGESREKHCRQQADAATAKRASGEPFRGDREQRERNERSDEAPVNIAGEWLEQRHDDGPHRRKCTRVEAPGRVFARRRLSIEIAEDRVRHLVCGPRVGTEERRSPEDQ